MPGAPGPWTRCWPSSAARRRSWMRARPRPVTSYPVTVNLLPQDDAADQGSEPVDLHGRTILQVLPALGTGGAERGCVDVAAAIEAAGGKALVASAGGAML